MKLRRSDVDEFGAVSAQLTTMRNDFVVFAKTKPDNALNKFKIRAANELLHRANEILGNAKPLSAFTELFEEDLPSNSDLAVVLSQYIAALETWRSAHVTKSGYDWYWDVDGPTIDADAPTRPDSRSKE